MPVLAIGADKSFGVARAYILRLVATERDVGCDSDSGHWLMEEQPAATLAAVRNVLDNG